MTRRIHTYDNSHLRTDADFIRWRDTTVAELGYRVYIATVRESHDVYGDPEQTIADRAIDALRLAAA